MTAHDWQVCKICGEIGCSIACGKQDYRPAVPGAAPRPPTDEHFKRLLGMTSACHCGLSPEGTAQFSVLCPIPEHRVHDLKHWQRIMGEQQELNVSLSHENDRLRAAPVEAPQPRRPFSELRKQMSPESQARASARTNALLADLELSEERLYQLAANVAHQQKSCPSANTSGPCSCCRDRVDFARLCFMYQREAAVAVAAAPQDALQALIVKWRKTGFDSGSGQTFFYECADELEAVLRASPAPEGEP